MIINDLHCWCWQKIQRLADATWSQLKLDYEKEGGRKKGKEEEMEGGREGGRERKGINGGGGGERESNSKAQLFLLVW